MTGYEALHKNAAWLDLSGRGLIRMTGEDRARLLHAMTTNHIQQMRPGDSSYAFFLNAQGRILADVTVVCREDHFLLDLEPETGAKIFEHLDKYIIADDVTIEDVSDQMAVIGVEGPAAPELAADAVPVSMTGAPGRRFYAGLDEKEALVARLEAAGAVAASLADANIVRLENGKPRYGQDITEKNLVHETRLLDAVSFNKGCYLGQEIVERVRSRGQVHRLLTPLRLNGEAVPSAGTKVLVNEAEAGEITSAAFSPWRCEVVALSFVRADHTTPGTAVQVGDVTGEVASPQP